MGEGKGGEKRKGTTHLDDSYLGSWVTHASIPFKTVLPYKLLGVKLYNELFIDT